MEKNQKIFSVGLNRDLNRLSAQFVSEFVNEVKPVLFAFGLSDDASIRKYIHSRTYEDIYRDAMANTPTALLEDKLCKLLRAPECSASTPIENGFSFRSMPLSDDFYRDKFLKAIIVENGILKVNESILREESIVKPEPWMVECYGMVSEFCERLKAKNFKRKNMKALFAYDKDGNLFPFAEGIFWGCGGLH